MCVVVVVVTMCGVIVCGECGLQVCHEFVCVICLGCLCCLIIANDFVVIWVCMYDCDVVFVVMSVDVVSCFDIVV